MIRITRSQQETQDVAREIAATLKAGDVLLLSGNLGAGKTAFVRGLAAGLGIDPEEVSSPTFTLLQEYDGLRFPLYHFDAYRLASEEEFVRIGAEDYLYGDGVCVIEWPELELSSALTTINGLLGNDALRPVASTDRLAATGPCGREPASDSARGPARRGLTLYAPSTPCNSSAGLLPRGSTLSEASASRMTAPTSFILRCPALRIAASTSSWVTRSFSMAS